MTDDDRALILRAVVALEKIADALYTEHNEPIADAVAWVGSKLENEDGLGVPEAIAAAASVIAR